MSQRRALEQIEFFLSTSDPEVLSISGRWGVGKTFAWDGRLAARRQSTPLRRYAYVSVFGLRSLDALKTAIVQSTVPLDGPDLEPSVESFVEHISSFAGLRRLGEHAARKGLNVFGKGVAAVPYVGKLADLLAPGAALLIRDQIICIDDIERAGQGLDVADILGLVSSLRERRRCKVILLLNEDGLGEQGRKYRDYLEKVVDQAIKFEPTPEQSASAAVDGQDALGAELVDRTIRLGIRNIRVIRRIRRFLRQIEPHTASLHPGVAGRVVTSIALPAGACSSPPSPQPWSTCDGMPDSAASSPTRRGTLTSCAPTSSCRATASAASTTWTRSSSPGSRPERLTGTRWSRPWRRSTASSRRTTCFRPSLSPGRSCAADLGTMPTTLLPRWRRPSRLTDAR